MTTITVPTKAQTCYVTILKLRLKTEVITYKAWLFKIGFLSHELYKFLHNIIYNSLPCYNLSKESCIQLRAKMEGGKELRLRKL